MFSRVEAPAKGQPLNLSIMNRIRITKINTKTSAKTNKFIYKYKTFWDFLASVLLSPHCENLSGLVYVEFLTDPGESRGCSTNTVGIN